MQDSEAHFKKRAKEAGIDDAVVAALNNNQINTLAHLAFTVGRPGQEVADNDFGAWVQQVAGGPQTTRQVASFVVSILNLKSSSQPLSKQQLKDLRACLSLSRNKCR